MIRLHDGTERSVPARYLEAGHVDHGYAMTIHKAQGLTADQALVLATDDLYHEAGYTALSRARLDTHIYAVADDFANDPSVDLSHAAQTRPEVSLAATLDRWLSREKSDQLAIETGTGSR